MRILTVCTGNICRSPMAEGILRSLLVNSSDTLILSAGTHAVEGNPATEFSVVTAAEHGIDISGHRAMGLTDSIIERSDVILCMEPCHTEWVLSRDQSSFNRIYNLADFFNIPGISKIFDPYGASIREYRECFKLINACLDNFVSSDKFPLKT